MQHRFHVGDVGDAALHHLLVASSAQLAPQQQQQRTGIGVDNAVVADEHNDDVSVAAAAVAENEDADVLQRLISSFLTILLEVIFVASSF